MTFRTRTRSSCIRGSRLNSADGYPNKRLSDAKSSAFGELAATHFFKSNRFVLCGNNNGLSRRLAVRAIKILGSPCRHIDNSSEFWM